MECGHAISTNVTTVVVNAMMEEVEEVEEEEVSVLILPLIRAPIAPANKGPSMPRPYAQACWMKLPYWYGACCLKFYSPITIY